MRRPTRPSRPTRSERRRERSEPSERPVSFKGTCTRRPSVVTTTATWRRLWPSNRPKMLVSRTRPGRPGRFAQSTRHFVIAQPPGPHVFARAGTKRRDGWGADPDPIPGVRSSGPDAKRPPVTRRSRHGLVRLDETTSSLPALPGLENECRAGERADGQQHPKGLSLQHASHQSHQRSPAPIVRAIDATSARAHVRRTRLPFTSDSFESVEIIVSRQPGGLPEKIPGFASPPRDGFALDGEPMEEHLRL
jgi:hypothetical protein